MHFIGAYWLLWLIIALFSFALVDGWIPGRRPSGIAWRIGNIVACASAFLFFTALVLNFFPCKTG